MPSLGAPEIILIILVILLLFGAKKLPDLARSVGRSMRIFKSEVKEMQAEDQTQPAPQAQIEPGQGQYNPQNFAQPAQPQQYQQPVQQPQHNQYPQAPQNNQYPQA